MQTCFMVSKRKNGGRTMKVRPSITLDDETDKLIGNPSAWNEHKCISFHNKEITNKSLPAESPNENLTNMQLKPSGTASSGIKLKNTLIVCKSGLRRQLFKRNGI